ARLEGAASLPVRLRRRGGIRLSLAARPRQHEPHLRGYRRRPLSLHDPPQSERLQGDVGSRSGAASAADRTRPMKVRHQVERLTPSEVSGWAIVPEEPEATVAVEIYAQGTLLATAAATIPR